MVLRFVDAVEVVSSELFDPDSSVVAFDIVVLLGLEVKALRREAKDLKKDVAEQTLELRFLKKVCSGMVGATTHEMSRI